MLLELIRVYWMRSDYADLRLGQIVDNLAQELKIDPFFVEDEALIKLLLGKRFPQLAEQPKQPEVQILPDRAGL